eukprot:2266115-Amphidinium_carterae.1
MLSRKHAGPANERAVCGRRVGTSLWVHFHSITAAALHVDGRTGNVVACCKGRLKTTKRWEFKYAEDNADCKVEDTDEVWEDVVLDFPVAAGSDSQGTSLFGTGSDCSTGSEQISSCS